MAYYQCIDCKYYDYSSTNRYDEGWCTEYCKYYPKSDRACSRFEVRNDLGNGGCFLTTAICNIFGFRDDCVGLESLRYLRDNYLVNDSRYHLLLAEYEVIGPVISENLYNDEHRMEVANYFYENYLYDIITDFIPNTNVDEAVSRYVDMTNELKSMYGITKDVTVCDVNNMTNLINSGQYKAKSKVRSK